MLENKMVKIIAIIICTIITIAGYNKNIHAQSNTHDFLKQYEPQNLKQTVFLKNPILKLGDVFENVPKKFNFALFRAPAPGKQAWLSIDELQNALLNNNIKWQKPRFPRKILIKRSGDALNRTILENIIIEKILEQQFMTKKQAENIKLNFIKIPRNVYLSKHEKKPIDILEIKFNQKKSNIKAVITIRDYDESQNFIIEAEIEKNVLIPVLKNKVKKGRSINIDMIEYKKFKQKYSEENLFNGFATKVENIVGFIAKNTIPQGQAISLRYLEKPSQVNKNDMIIVSYYQDGLSIKMKAKALQKGFTGDVIQIRNLQSNKNFKALVIEKGVVKVIQ